MGLCVIRKILCKFAKKMFNKKFTDEKLFYLLYDVPVGGL